MNYYGERIGSLVCDIGTANFRLGYAGDDMPISVLNTSLGKNIEKNKYCIDISKSKTINPSIEISNPVEYGLINNWDELSELFKYSINERMKLSFEEHPIIVSEVPYNTNDRREKLAKMLFEDLNFNSIYIAKDSVLTSFAVGRSSALIMNIGAGATTCIPVHQGFSLVTDMLKTRISGNYIDEMLDKDLMSNNANLSYNNKLSDGKNTKSYEKYMKFKLIKEIKEDACYISNKKIESLENLTINKKQFKLPDGKIIKIGAGQITATENLFSPNNNFVEADDIKCDYKFIGIDHMIKDCLMKTDPDIRKTLISNVIITGGSVQFKGFYKRIFSSLNDILTPSLNKLKIIIPSNKIKSSFSTVWLGGSILGSLSAFNQFWISKKDYEENGERVIYEKCY